MYKKLLILSLIKIRTYAYYNEPSNVCDLVLNFTMLMKFIICLHNEMMLLKLE